MSIVEESSTNGLSPISSFQVVLEVVLVFFFCFVQMTSSVQSSLASPGTIRHIQSPRELNPKNRLVPLMDSSVCLSTLGFRNDGCLENNNATTLP